ncbi:hypothetical protein KAT08_00615 [Candidatus Babeliales bacterium]|nr:hypothetical protein [Candidatus Babeliales bacterium]
MKKKLLFLGLLGFLLFNSIFCLEKIELKDEKKEEQILEKNLFSDLELEEEFLDCLDSLDFSDLSEDVDKDLTLKDKLALIFFALKLKSGMLKETLINHFKNNEKIYLSVGGTLISLYVLWNLVPLLW